MIASRRYLIAALVATTAVAGAQSTTPRTMQVVWRAGGGDDADSSFAQIYAVAVSPKGDVVAWDPKTPALRLFNDAGKFVRTIGRKGAGPGEYGSVSGIAYDKDGRFYAWDSGNARLNVYKPNGDFDRQMRLPITGFSTNDGLTIDSQGRAWLRFVIFDRAAGKSDGAWLRVRASDGATIDTVKQPRIEGGDPQLVAQSKCCMSSQSLPYGKNPSFALTASGDIMIAQAGKYEVDVPYRGRVVKIQRTYTPVKISNEERVEQREIIEKNLRNTQPDWTWPSAGIPSVKPPLQSISGALDGRVWVSLYVESERFTPDPPATKEANAAPPRTFRAAGRKWDVFEPDGRYAGTVVAPNNITPRVMRGDFAWGVALDEDDLPTLVKLKIVPPFGSR
jgi:hypothetical protein